MKAGRPCVSRCSLRDHRAVVEVFFVCMRGAEQHGLDVAGIGGQVERRGVRTAVLIAHLAHVAGVRVVDCRQKPSCAEVHGDSLAQIPPDCKNLLRLSYPQRTMEPSPRRHTVSITHDRASTEQRVAERNLAAEVRAMDEGHACRIDHSRGVFVVVSDTYPWQYVLTARAVDGLVVLSCTAEHKPSAPGVVIPAQIQHHARRSGPGVLGCKHAARVVQRLKRAGLVRLGTDGRWYATEKAEVLGND